MPLIGVVARILTVDWRGEMGEGEEVVELPQLRRRPADGGLSVYALGSMGRRVLSHKAQAAKRMVEQ
jgi:hypothetical protein